MVKRIWCTIWGHNNIVKVYQGNYKTFNPFTNTVGFAPLIKKERLDFCQRCGCKMDKEINQ